MKKFIYRHVEVISYALYLLFALLCIIGVIQLERVLQEPDEPIYVYDEDIFGEDETVDEDVENTVVEVQTARYTETVKPRLYTNEDIIVLSKMLWGEARGVPELNEDGNRVSSKCQQAAVVWTVLNRYDKGYADSIADVVKKPHQYVGYSRSNPIDNDLMDLVLDVLDRWEREKNGEEQVGRVIPKDYIWFLGDGTYNNFRNKYNSDCCWSWDLEDPYI